MKKLFATTALALILSGPALAQTATTQPGAAAGSAASMAWLSRGEARDVYASDMIGATLYAAEDGRDTFDGRDDWESVGSIHDVLLSRDGKVRAVLVDVGEFLGMGGKTVATPVDAIRFVSDGDEADEYFLVISTSREALEAAPEYVRPEMDDDGRSAANRDDDGRRPGANRNDDGRSAANRNDDGGRSGANRNDGARADMRAAPGTPGKGRDAASDATFSHEGYTRAANDDLTVEDIDDLAIYDRNDRSIGSVNELLVDGDGKITDAVVDVGGFLGMGARSVAIKFSDLTVMREDGGDDVRLYVDATKESLEAMPRYQK